MTESSPSPDGVGRTLTRNKEGKATSTSHRPSFLLLGDSITQFGARHDPVGWSMLLASKYTGERKADILNEGFSGYNTRWVLRILPHILKDVPQNQVLLVTVMLGANDATAPDHYQHVPLDEYGDNLRAIVEQLRQTLPNAIVIILSPPPLDFDAHNSGRDPNDKDGRSLENVQKYAARAMKVAQDAQVLSLDICTLMHAEPNWKEMLCDGLHLASSGNGFLHDQLMQLITAKTPHLTVEALPLHLPHHTEAGQFDFGTL
uniref:SGNH hydrolase-type esterase domain-containing protein n=1 Tax=Eutreptiella gymnastica TaxID=73025 RepID=A0A7S1NIF2_9EUGL